MSTVREYREAPYVRTQQSIYLAQSIKHREQIPSTLVHGHLGTGKSFTVKNELDLTGVPYFWITSGKNSRIQDYFGHWTMINGETVFEKGILYQALESEEGVVVLDDCHQLGDSLQVLNSACDLNNRMVSVPELGLTLEVPRRVSFILISNPQDHLPPWERGHAAVPPQIIARSRVIEFKASLPKETEWKIMQAYWDKNLGSEEELSKLIETVRNLRDNGQLGSYTPAIRDLVIFCDLKGIGLDWREAFAQALAHKYSPEDRIAVWTAYDAVFHPEPQADQPDESEKKEIPA